MKQIFELDLSKPVPFTKLRELVDEVENCESYGGDAEVTIVQEPKHLEFRGGDFGYRSLADAGVVLRVALDS